MRFRHVAAAALGLSLLATASQAQSMMSTSAGTYGPYLRLEGGWNHTSDTSGKGSSSSLNFNTSQDDGYIVGGAAGYGWGTFRLEVNIDHRDNSLSSIHVGNPGAFVGLPANGGAGGNVRSLTMMVNGLFDLPLHFWGLQPYAGAGVGAARISLDHVSIGGVGISNDTDTAAALQAMLGVRYALTENWGLGLEYRFLNAFGPNFKDGTGNRFSTNDYRNHSILLSVTYAFGAPAPMAPTPAAAPAPAPRPAPAAAPAAAAPRQLFIVFFDFDKSTITEAGRKVLDAAADAIKRDMAVRIMLTGYTDTMGTQQYNMGLSKRRADTVRDYLVRAGVPANRMNVDWKGKENLRVPTPDGVREPQNRRVEIVLP